MHQSPVTFSRVFALTCGLLCILLFRHGCSVDVYTSTAQIRKLVKSEKQLTEALQVYIFKEELRIERMKKALERLRNSSNQQAIDETVSHPLNAYRVIKHYVDALKDVTTEDAALRNHQEFLHDMHSGALYMPDNQDMAGAAVALLRLQRVYKLKTEDLVNGNVFGHKTAPLSGDDCVRIGETALMQDDMKIAHSWLMKALENNQTLTEPVSGVLTSLAKVYHIIGDYVSAMDLSSQAAALDPYNEFVLQRMSEHMESFQIAANTGVLPTKIENFVAPRDAWHYVYEGLCRGDQFQEQPWSKDLLCRYRPTSIPYAPVKEELLSFSPRIAMLYDVISEQEADTVKELATEQLQRATVGDPSNSEISEQRISKIGWLWDNIHGDVIGKLSRRVGQVTGLDTEFRDVMSRAEPFQVVNYGLAGQYEPHVDFYEDPEMLKRTPSYLQETGDRIATFMFYLNDVTAGGATVFTQALVRVPPVKGAAAFWYNSRKNGQFDRRTEHAGCPVLVGEKWVANKWIHEAGQEFRRPCGRSQDQDYIINE